LLDRYFEHELVKGLFMFFALVAVYAGPTSPGTAYEFSHHSWGEYKGEFGRFAFARGGMGTITKALASVAQLYEAEIHTGVTVDRIVVRLGAVAGVRLEDGTVLECKTVLSNACHTYLQLLDSNDIPSTLLAKVHQIDMRGSMGRVHLLVDRLPQYFGMSSSEGPQHRGFTLLAATPAAFERG
jgi:phytoene dehydrogenase-like protein